MVRCVQAKVLTEQLLPFLLQEAEHLVVVIAARCSFCRCGC